MLSEDPGLAKYLDLRAKALLTDDYKPSDLAWMDMRDNRLDIVIGPIESYEDQLAGIKTSAEAYVLVKDLDWSKRLLRYTSVLPELQKGLPVPAEYKKEKPGSGADLAAYDVVFYAGDCNAGSKTIAINLPNDESVQLEKGTRRVQLKNAIKAKFDSILKPIANLMIVPEQKDQVTFEAFFADTMFHEVAHGLGIKNTIDGKTTVREALGEHYAALEEGKADVLGLYMIHSLEKKGEDVGATAEAADVTFVAGIFRSIRFGAASAHGVANLIRFNYFKEKGAFTRNADGRYQIDYPKLRQAANDLSEKILRLQGDGNKQAVADFVAKYGQIDATLKGDLDRINTAEHPGRRDLLPGPRRPGHALRRGGCAATSSPPSSWRRRSPSWSTCCGRISSAARRTTSARPISCCAGPMKPPARLRPPSGAFAGRPGAERGDPGRRRAGLRRHRSRAAARARHRRPAPARPFPGHRLVDHPFGDRRGHRFGGRRHRHRHRRQDLERRARRSTRKASACAPWRKRPRPRARRSASSPTPTSGTPPRRFRGATTRTAANTSTSPSRWPTAASSCWSAARPGGSRRTMATRGRSSRSSSPRVTRWATISALLERANAGKAMALLPGGSLTPQEGEVAAGAGGRDRAAPALGVAQWFLPAGRNRGDRHRQPRPSARADDARGEVALDAALAEVFAFAEPDGPDPGPVDRRPRHRWPGDRRRQGRRAAALRVGDRRPQRRASAAARLRSGRRGSSPAPTTTPPSPADRRRGPRPRALAGKKRPRRGARPAFEGPGGERRRPAQDLSCPTCRACRWSSGSRARPDRRPFRFSQ